MNRCLVQTYWIKEYNRLFNMENTVGKFRVLMYLYLTYVSQQLNV